MRRFGIWRFGADAQFYCDVPALGGLAVKGEMVLSQDTQQGFPRRAGRPVPRHQGLRLDPDRATRTSATTSASRRASTSGIPTATPPDASCTDAPEGCRPNDKITTLGIGPLLLHLRQPEGVRRSTSTCGATTASSSAQRARPVRLGAERSVSPCSCRPGSRFPIRDPRFRKQATTGESNMKLRALIAPLVGGGVAVAVRRCPRSAGTITVKGSDTMVVLGPALGRGVHEEEPGRRSSR